MRGKNLIQLYETLYEEDPPLERVDTVFPILIYICKPTGLSLLI